MPASHFESITFEMISTFLTQPLKGVVLMNGKKLQNEYVQEKVNARLESISPFEVREELYKEIRGNTPLDEIAIAVCLACEIPELWEPEWYVVLE